MPKNAANPVNDGGVRKFNKHVLNPLMLHLAGRKHWYAGVIRHTGRRTGQVHQTPVVAVRVADHIVTPLPYGADTDWLRNARKAGKATITTGGERFDVVNPPGSSRQPMQRHCCPPGDFGNSPASVSTISPSSTWRLTPLRNLAMKTDAVRSLADAPGPFVSLLVDDSHDTHDAVEQAEARWTGIGRQLEDRDVADDVIAALKRAVLHSTPVVGRKGRLVIAGPDAVLVNEQLDHAPPATVVRVSDYPPYLLPPCWDSRCRTRPTSLPRWTISAQISPCTTGRTSIPKPLKVRAIRCTNPLRPAGTVTATSNAPPRKRCV